MPGQQHTADNLQYSPHHTVDIGGDLLPKVSYPVALLR